MWISKELYRDMRKRLELQETDIQHVRSFNAQMVGAREQLLAQKAKDDITIDWMRHRVNALEKTNAILLQKAAGVSLPVPEIVPTRPGTLTMPNFDSLPSFEDVGDEEAKRLGVAHDEAGYVQFHKDVAQQ